MLYLFVNFEIGESFQKSWIRIHKCDAADKDIKENDMIPLGLPCFAGGTKKKYWQAHVKGYCQLTYDRSFRIFYHTVSASISLTGFSFGWRMFQRCNYIWNIMRLNQREILANRTVDWLQSETLIC